MESLDRNLMQVSCLKNMALKPHLSIIEEARVSGITVGATTQEVVVVVIVGMFGKAMEVKN